MICNLPQLLLPQRLASITSIEMVWHIIFCHEAAPDDSLCNGFPAFHSLLKILPLTFPHLQELTLSLQGNASPPDRRAERIFMSESAINSSIMIPFDNLVREVALQRCSIYIPLSLYDILRRQAKGSLLRSRWGSGGSCTRLWRDLPKVGTGDERPASTLRGYWICLGEVDDPLTFISTYL